MVSFGRGSERAQKCLIIYQLQFSSAAISSASSIFTVNSKYVSLQFVCFRPFVTFSGWIPIHASSAWTQSSSLWVSVRSLVVSMQDTKKGETIRINQLVGKQLAVCLKQFFFKGVFIKNVYHLQNEENDTYQVKMLQIHVKHFIILLSVILCHSTKTNCQ